MRVLFDTSALVAALIEEHPFNHLAFPWFFRAIQGELDFRVAAHSLAETYSSLTNYPIRPRIPPAAAHQLLSQEVASKATIVALEAADYLLVTERQARLGLIGGSVYDALLARAAEKSEADLLLTLNPKDFLRVWPEGAEKIRVP